MPKKKQTDVKKIEEKLKDCEKQKKEYLAGWQRERADFINYKKDELKKIEELVKYASSGMLLKLLPILDNFDIAEKNVSKESKDVKGLLQIKSQLEEFLKNNGIERIEVVGKQFDPSCHEVIELVEDKKKKSGTIVEEVQKGYKVYGKLLRPAKVKAIK